MLGAYRWPPAWWDFMPAQMKIGAMLALLLLSDTIVSSNTERLKTVLLLGAFSDVVNHQITMIGISPIAHDHDVR